MPISMICLLSAGSRDVAQHQRSASHDVQLIPLIPSHLWLIASASRDKARRRAEELARDADIRLTIPRPPKVPRDTRTVTLAAPKVTAHDRLPIAGTVLTRKYRGRQVEVKVLPNGFDYDGQGRTMRRGFGG